MDGAGQLTPKDSLSLPSTMHAERFVSSQSCIGIALTVLLESRISKDWKNVFSAPPESQIPCGHRNPMRTYEQSHGLTLFPIPSPPLRRFQLPGRAPISTNRTNFHQLALGPQSSTCLEFSAPPTKTCQGANVWQSQVQISAIS
jgi:hypothetical protein